MTSILDKPVVIVGAGLAGLTLGLKLIEGGVPTVIVEREERVGGLARSFSYPNGAIFDIGPHRFHTDSPRVQAFVLDVLGDNVHWIKRNSTLFLFGKYLPWPMTLKNALSLPPHLLMQAGLDLLRPRRARTESFEDYIIEKYGRTLYKIFFQPYTEKFLEYTCSNLHRDWAMTGINRATIDKRVNTSSLWDFAKTVLRSNAPDTEFIYPGAGGIGAFPEALAERFIQQGGRILTSSPVADIQFKDRKIQAVVTGQDEVLPASHVFWSGSLTALRAVGRAPESVPQLHYMSTILFNYVLKRHITPGFQWCYFGDKHMAASRACLPRFFDEKMAPPGREPVCIEISSSEGSPAWNDPARLDCIVETFLLHANMLDTLDNVENYHVEHIHETYPLYVLNYPRKLRDMFSWVDETWANMTLIGRTGRFWYNNMDHSIEASLVTADRFLADIGTGAMQPGHAYAAEDRYLEGLST